jgi:hypothetical protein
VRALHEKTTFFREMFIHHGIARFPSPPHMPKYNGSSAATNRAIRHRGKYLPRLFAPFICPQIEEEK